MAGKGQSIHLKLGTNDSLPKQESLLSNEILLSFPRRQNEQHIQYFLFMAFIKHPLFVTMRQMSEHDANCQLQETTSQQ